VEGTNNNSYLGVARQGSRKIENFPNERSQKRCI